jgi:hypothetical protein
LPEEETYSVPLAAGQGTAVELGFALEDEIGDSRTGTVREELPEAEADEPGGTTVILEDVVDGDGGEFPNREPPTFPGLSDGERVCEPILRKQFPPASKVVE